MPDVLRTLPRDVRRAQAVESRRRVGAAAPLHGRTTASRPGAATPMRPVRRDRASAALVDAIATDGHGLVMLMGKGGVGKTTIAAAVAVALADGACRST